MKKLILDAEEEQILRDLEDGVYVSVPNIEEEKERFRVIASHTLRPSPLLVAFIDETERETKEGKGKISPTLDALIEDLNS